MQRMQTPSCGSNRRESQSLLFLKIIKLQESESEGKKRDNSSSVQTNVVAMIRRWMESKQDVLNGVSQPLEGPIKIRRRRVCKKKMLQPFRDQAPAPDERIAQDQGGIIPDETGTEGRGMSAKNKTEEHADNGQTLFHETRCSAER